MVEHIDQAYLRKKGIQFFFRPQHFRELGNLARIYSPFGVMALWDVHMESTNLWVRECGYSFESFLACIPRLVDDKRWKVWRESYEKKFVGDYPDIPVELKMSVSLSDSNNHQIPSKETLEIPEEHK
jgi:hypothetical protein